MAKFEVDFSEAFRQLAAFQSRLETMGNALDKLQKDANKPNLAASNLIKAVTSNMVAIEGSLAGYSKDMKATLNAMDRAADTAIVQLGKVAAANLRLTASADAYLGKNKELERLLADTSAKSSFVRWAEKTSNLTNELAGQNKYLSAQIKALGTEEGRANLVRKATLASQSTMLTASHRMALANKELKQQEELLGSMYGRSNAALKARIAETVKAFQEEAKLTGKLAEHQRAEESLTNGIRRQITAQAERNKGIEQAITFEQREQNSVNELLRRQQSLNGGLAEQAAMLRVLNSAREKEITELTRERAKIEELQRALVSLNGGEQEQITRLNAKIAARRRAIMDDGKAAVVMEELSAAAARLIVSDQRHKASIEAKNRATLEEARALQQMTKAEAEAIAKTDALAAANKRHSEILLDEARKAHGMSKAQKELTDTRQREIDRLVRLQAQKDLLDSSYGRSLASLQAQIAEQQRYNRLLAMGTAELLGFTSAQNRKTAALNMGSQSAAMMRAALSGLNTSIGMYTSSTIIAAASTYALFSALRNTVSIGAEFTATMTKAEAIMTPKESWLPSNMDAMEAQVRALGQATMYTASEVAGGLVELGQAGLSASDAMTALKPALDLAVIGGINMGQSADIATNVMMTFGMEARDLTEVVDVMAKAATDSNTNIEQLANALTYAGPAAHTAGISMRDTVAAIEALSNTGIKASRAGTGLRRLFVSLLNPTEKGSAMMDKYGISVTDAEGKTRGLVDILGQLKDALHAVDVSEGERLGAVQDLVGVYATSPVAALIGQAGDGGNLEYLRRQLDEVSGSAQRMREKIEDSLKYDWKQVTSAFEEAQLQLFDAHEYRLREISSSLTSYLVDLTRPFKELQGEDGTTTVITNLDMLIQKATVAAEAVAAIMGGAMALKLVGGAGGVFGAMAADAAKAGPILSVLTTRLSASAAAHSALSVAARGTSASLVVAHGAATIGAGSMGLLAVGASYAAKAVYGLGVAINVAGKFLGWAGLLFSVGYALKTVFGADNEQAILDQREEVDKLKESYESLQKQIEASGLARERAALNKQIGNDQQQIGAATENSIGIRAAIATYESEGLKAPQALYDQLVANDRIIENSKKSIEGAAKTLQDLKTTQVETLSLAQQANEKAAELARLRQVEVDALAAYTAAEGRMRLKEKDAWEAATAAVAAYKAELDEATSKSNEAASNAASMMDHFNLAMDQQDQTLAAKAFEQQATAAEKLLKVQSDIRAMQDNVAEARDNGETDVMDRKLAKLLELRTAEQELRLEVEGQTETLAEAQRAYDDFHRTDAENLVILKEELAQVVAQRAVYNHLRTYGSPGLADELETERLKKELELLQAIAGITAKQEKANKAGKPRGKSEAEKLKEKAEREAEQALQKAKSTYDSLRQKFDPLGVSMDDVAEKTEQLNLLVGEGTITVAQKAQALAHLRKEHYELTLEQDKNYQALLKLREAYGTSPFSATLGDLTELNRLLREGKVSLGEHARLAEQVRAKQGEEVLSGLPTADTRLEGAASTPFGEFASTQIESAQGMAAFRQREMDLENDLRLNEERIALEAEQQRAALEAKELTQEAHSAEMLRIQQAEHGAWLSAHEKFGVQNNKLNQATATYGEQMGKMALISAMGAAEGLLGQFASVAEGATTAQKAAFVAQKALAIAQILMYTHLAAAQAMAIPGDTTKVLGIPLASFITAQGYASAGLVAALSIGQMAGGETSSGGGSSYAGAYDDGGFIPYNSYGIVGEYGPEIVHGPANVTSRKESAKQLSGGSDAEYNITLAPQITVTTSGGQGGDPVEQGKQLAATVKSAVMSTLSDQMRPNGALDTWMRNQRNR